MLLLETAEFGCECLELFLRCGFNAVECAARGLVRFLLGGPAQLGSLEFSLNFVWYGLQLIEFSGHCLECFLGLLGV